MRIVDRYIIKSIITVFLACLALFYFLYVLIDAFGLMDDYISKNVPMSVIINYYLSYLPVLIVNTAPIACLIACMMTYSRLNSNNEVIALRASGLNFFQIAKPALSFALMVSALVFLVNERFVPQSNMAAEQIKKDKIKATIEDMYVVKKGSTISNLTFYGLKNRLYFIDTFDPEAGELTGITIIGHDENQNLMEKVVAFRGVWTGINWKFFNVQISTFEASKPNVIKDIKSHDEKLMDIKETPKDFLKQRLNVNSMNISQLSSYLEKFSGSGAIRAINNLKVDLYHKTAYPLSSLIIVLAGLPLVLSLGRRKVITFASIGIAVAMGFLFYVFNAVGLALGKGGAVHPFLAAWLAPICFLILAIFLIRRLF